MFGIFSLITNDSRRDEALRQSLERRLLDIQHLKNIKDKNNIKLPQERIAILPAHRTNIRWTKKNRRAYTKDDVRVVNVHGMITVAADYIFDRENIPAIIESAMKHSPVYVFDKELEVQIYDYDLL